MKYYELTCIAYLKKDINFKNSFETINKYISYSMAQSSNLKDLHNKNKFKHYTFDIFYPTEKSQIYHKNHTYNFNIRSIDENFINTISTTLRENINNPNIQILQTNKRIIKQQFITELYTATPTIISIDNGLYWTAEKDGDILKLQKQLHDNLEKKYQDFFEEPIQSQQNFIQLLEIKNKYPQSIYTTKKIKDKIIDIRLFGNKFRIVPNEDEVSQKLAFIALACGLGEKNSYGGGFCLGRGIR